MNSEQLAQLRALPSVDGLVEAVDGLVEQYGREQVVAIAREVLNAVRGEILGGDSADIDTLPQRIKQQLAARFSPTLIPLINATGVIVHTNLGRAPLSAAANSATTEIALGYSNLEFDVPSGKRGSRSVHASDLIRQITGAEAATVVNNSAAGVLLMLSALCVGKEVIVSRGQLVEIGGGFRMPDVMRQADVTLVEVGTTNRTHLRDYANAITENTAAILSIHHSNYKIIGFTTEPSLRELADLAHAHDLPLLYDQGSGAFVDTTQFGLEREPLVQSSVSDGCDVIVFSGDKLLGGPQAGVICGREDLIATIKRHPLARAVRPGKLTFAALSATLDSYLRGAMLDEIPVWQMVSLSVDAAGERAARIVEALGSAEIEAHVVDGESTVGGGSLPGQTLATKVVAVRVDDVEGLAARLRERGVIGRIQSNTFYLDPRTVLEHQFNMLLEILSEI